MPHLPLTYTRDAAHCPTLTGGGAETAVQGGWDGVAINVESMLRNHPAR